MKKPRPVKRRTFAGPLTTPITVRGDERTWIDPDDGPEAIADVPWVDKIFRKLEILAQDYGLPPEASHGNLLALLLALDFVRGFRVVRAKKPGRPRHWDDETLAMVLAAVLRSERRGTPMTQAAAARYMARAEVGAGSTTGERRKISRLADQWENHLAAASERVQARARKIAAGDLS